MSIFIERRDVEGKHYTHEIMALFDIDIRWHGFDGYDRVIRKIKDCTPKTAQFSDLEKLDDNSLVQSLAHAFKEGTEIDISANVTSKSEAESLIKKWRDIILFEDPDLHYQIVIAERAYKCHLFYCQDAQGDIKKEQTLALAKYLDGRRVPYTLSPKKARKDFIEVILHGNSKTINRLVPNMEKWWRAKSSSYMSYNMEITHHQIVDSYQIQNEAKLMALAGFGAASRKPRI